MKRALSCSFIISCFVSVSAFAQGENFFKDMLKESLRETIKNSVQNSMQSDPLYENLFPDSTWKTIEINVNKQPLPRLGYNYRQNSFYLNYKDSLPLDPQYTLSPNLRLVYTDWDWKQEPNPSVAENMFSAFLRPVNSAGLVMVSPAVILYYLMNLGILPNEPSPPRQSKHEKALQHITKEIYPNGD